MNIGATIKAHPYMTGAIVIGGGLTFFFLSGWFTGGSSTPQVVAGGPSDAEVMASTQLALAGISAGVANNQISAEFGAATIAGEIAKLQAELETSLGLAAVEAGKTVSLADIGAGQAMFAGQIAYQTQSDYLGASVQSQGIAATTSVNLANIDATKEIEQAKLTQTTQLTKMIIDALKPATQQQTPVTSTPITEVPVTVSPSTQVQEITYNPVPVWNPTSYLQANPDVAREYQSASSSSKGQKSLAEYGVSSATDFAEWHYSTFGQYENRAF
jgi:hypothetical protein